MAQHRDRRCQGNGVGSGDCQECPWITQRGLYGMSVDQSVRHLLDHYRRTPQGFLIVFALRVWFYGCIQVRARRPAQLLLRRTSGWGGARKGAGRKPIAGRRRPTPHQARPRHRGGHPVHVTLRARPGVPSLRAPEAFPAVLGALRAAGTSGFRVIQFSVQADHLHLLVEGADTRTLALGIRGLIIRVARAVNRALGRSGSVWNDRYHARALTTPREVRHGLVYVLMNFRKHVRHQPFGVDPCSSAPWFDGFRRPAPERPPDDPPVATPRSWLAGVGWRRYGLIGVYERPAGVE
jgi:putative transposase